MGSGFSGGWNKQSKINLPKTWADGGVVDEVITTVDATIIRRMELEALESKPTLSRKLEPIGSAFCSSGKAVAEAYVDLINSTKKTLDCILKLQEALIEKISPFMEAAQAMLHDPTLTV
ncbi:hypothetical protein LXL04_006574 [Taraxacum kok-saghyz]